MPNIAETCTISSMWERFRTSTLPITVAGKTYEQPYSESYHIHDFPQMWYCVEGKYTHTVGDETFSCGSGSLVIIPPGVPHTFSVVPENICSFYQTNLIFNIFSGFENKNMLRCAIFMFLQNFSHELRFEKKIHITIPQEEKPAADEIFKKLSECNTPKVTRSVSHCRNLLGSLFSLSPFEISEKVLSRAEKFIKEKYLPLLRTIYHMNIHYGEKITREELVELSGICQTDYFRYIKRICGFTFSTYLQRIRVRHATVLATFSPYSLSYIADICGFGDLTYMENRIKKFSGGRLPSSMRQNRKNFVKMYPYMIMTRDDYERLPMFFEKLD